MKINGLALEMFFLSITKLVTIASGILTTKILSNSLSLLEYGTYSQANVAVSVIVSIISFGLSDCVNYFYNRNEDGIEKVKWINTIFLLEIILGIVVGVVTILGFKWIVYFFDNLQLKMALPLIIIKPVLDNIIYFYQVLFVSIGKSKVIAARNLMVSIAKVGLLVISIGYFRSLNAIFQILIALDLIQFVFFTHLFAKEKYLIKPWRGKIRMVAPIIKYGLPIGIYTFTNTLTRDIDKLIVGRLSNVQMSAIYANCSKILPFDIVATSLATILIPYIIRNVQSKRLGDATYIFKNYLRVGFYSVWTLGMAVLLVADESISFLYSETYLKGKIIFVIYVVDSMVRFASSHLVLTAEGKTSKLLKYSIISLSVNFVSSVFLYGKMGAIGPAVATLLSALLYTYLVLNETSRILNSSILNLLDCKKSLAFLLRLGVLFVLGCLLKILFEDLISLKYIRMLFLIGLYILAVLVYNRRQFSEVLRNINDIRKIQ